jgi:aryl-alcohol dehydrogenase-like predicted oxidoreductase
MFRQFVAEGATVIDTAPAYGASEELIGELVEELGIRDRVFLATKVGADGREAGMEMIENSFRRLRVSQIDLLAVHSLRDYQTQLPALKALKEEGRIRYLGITTSRGGQNDELEGIMRREPLDFVQVTYAVDDRDPDRTLLPLAADRGIAVMINLAFGRGRLFEAVQGTPLPEWTSEFDCGSWAQFFLKYVVSHPAVTCAIPGMSRVEHLMDNLGAARGRLPDSAQRRMMEQFIDGLG